MAISIQVLLTLVIAALLTIVQSSVIPRGHGNQISGLGVQVANVDATNVIENRYIVVYNKNATDDAVLAHQNSVKSALKKRNYVVRRDGTVKLLSTIVDTVSMSGWRCMALEAEDSMVSEIQSAAEVS